MTLAEARKILGLGPNDDPGPKLQELGDARERIATMVRNAPNETIAKRYQKGLTEFDEALALLTSPPATQAPAPPPAPPSVFQKSPEPEPPEPLPSPPAPVAEAEAPAPAPPVPTPEAPVFQKSPETEPPEPPLFLPAPAPAAEITEPEPPVPAATNDRRYEPPLTAPVADSGASEPGPEDPEPPPAPRKSRALAYTCWFLVVFIATTGAGLFYLKVENDRYLQRQARIVFLERQGAVFIENRRWPEAAAAFDEIEGLEPGSRIASLGRNSIEAGITEEQTQFIAYWTGQAIASLEAGLWQDAEAAARQVLDKFPGEKEAIDILARAEETRRTAERNLAIAKIRKLLESNNWDPAISAAQELAASHPDDPEISGLLAQAIADRDTSITNMARAREILTRAKALDQGRFDQAMLDLLREAAALSPGDTEIQEQLEKMSSYTRTIRVPGDFDTPAEALAEARDRDRIVLAAGVWKGPLIANAAIDLQGAGPSETIIECPAEEGCALTLGPGANGSHIAGITFRHETFAPGNDRFSTVLARGANATFSDCRFLEASGHGLAAIEGAHIIATRCRFTGNGWNGVAAIGAGTLLEVRESEAAGNFEHGIESWDGAAVILVKNRCEDNSRNGIHADNGAASATIEGNQLISNREFGIVIGSAGSGRVSGNTIRGNSLGGLVLRAAAASVSVTNNTATGNRGPGMVLDKGLLPAAYTGNKFTGNGDPQILADTDLSAEEKLPEALAPAPDDATETPPAAIIVPEDEIPGLEEP